MQEHAVDVGGQLHTVVDGRANAIDFVDVEEVKCEGNACREVTVKWTGGGYRLTNKSADRAVRISIRWTFGFQCLDPSDIDLEPEESAEYANGGYCPPYQANYI